MHIPIVYAYAFKQFIISFHGVEWERMEESSKILKFYKSTRNGFQLRYCDRRYTKKIRNRPNYKNYEFVCNTADCYATVFLAVNLILGGKYVITEPLSVLRSNDKHIPSCNEKDESFFVNIEELQKIKESKINSTNSSDSTLVSESDSDFDPNEPESDEDIESCLDR